MAAWVAVLAVSVATTAHAQSTSSVTIADGLAGDVKVTRADDAISIDWPTGGASDERGQLRLSLAKDAPLIQSIGVGGKSILANVDPSAVLTIGTRDLKPAGWIVFFDNPRNRPYEAFPFKLTRDAIRVEKAGGHTTVTIDGASAGPFSGVYRFTIYPGSPLVRAAMVMSTERDATAYTFDAGLTVAERAASPWKSIAYTDLKDELVRVSSDENGHDARSPQVRLRTVLAEGKESGTVAIVPPPHQYFYPLDYANNDNTVWIGKNYRKLDGLTGFGVRQTLEGDRRFVPWVNAPPKTQQDMGIFYFVDAGDAATATKNIAALTRGDSFKPIDGQKTFTSHYHVEHTVDFLNRKKFQQSTGVPAGLENPAFVRRFKDAGLDIVHLGELHLGQGDLDRAGDRLTLLRTMHEECARLSDETFLLLPGEEPNVHLGGHWISFFPSPVMWTLDRKDGQPFVEEKNGEKIYHVGNSDDVLRLMKEENGLMWTAHPRIKASTGFPDVYKAKDYFKSDRYLGGAWKAMPADYSIPRLGSRVIELLDDMNNWAANPSERKFIPGEVDIFQIDERSELYAHMNVNYLRLDTIPSFKAGWQPVLDALRNGAFFTTTGEVLIPSFTIDGKASGEAIAKPSGQSTLRAKIEWTFPLSYAEVITGDGTDIQRQPIDLTDTKPFGTRELEIPIDLRGKKWARLEVWDIGTSGAYTQPVFVE